MYLAAGADPGGPLSESLGIDFYSGFRKKSTFIVASEKNPSIYFYSDFRKKIMGVCNSKS